MHLKEGEERTAGSDPRIRFSSGGPISLDPDKNFTMKEITKILLELQRKEVDEGALKGKWC
jgi:hypothetical protein